MTEVWDEQFARAESKLEGDSLGLQEPEEEYPSGELISLLHIGNLSKEVNIRGHLVRLRTLTMGEELEVGPLIQRYNGTPEEGRAYACAVVASAIESVDGKPLVLSLGKEESIGIQQQKFDYLRSRWYWPVIQEVYEEYVALQREQLAALQELQSK